MTGDISHIRDVTDWIYDGDKFDEDCGDIEGASPAELIQAWGPWVVEMTLLIDGDGTFRHFPEGGTLRDQPARDMLILSIAKNRWVERMNKKAAGGT